MALRVMGRIMGTITRLYTCSSVAPSTRAASLISVGIPRRAARYMAIVYPDICHVAARTTEIMARETPMYGLASPPSPMWPRRCPKPESGWM